MDFSENTKREIIEEQYLSDYTSSQMWDVYSDFGKIHNKLKMPNLFCSIFAVGGNYHLTRDIKPSVKGEKTCQKTFQRYLIILRLTDIYAKQENDILIRFVIFLYVFIVVVIH